MQRFFPLFGGGARMALLQAVCAAAEHGQFRVCAENDEPAAARVVRAVLRNTRSFSNINGVTGLPRSLNSTYAAAVALYLNAGFRGRLQRKVIKPRVGNIRGCIAATPDGCTLIVCTYASSKIPVINSRTGSLEHTIGSVLGPYSPSQVCVASDGHVFITDWYTRRVYVYTPRFEFYASIETEYNPYGVYADTDIVAVSEPSAPRISVYSRGERVLLYHFGSSELGRPTTLCFLPRARHIACADIFKNRVSVFSVHGELIRHLYYDDWPRVYDCCGLAYSSSDELVVGTRDRIVVFNAAGDEVQSIDVEDVSSIALHGGTMYTFSFREAYLQVLN